MMNSDFHTKARESPEMPLRLRKTQTDEFGCAGKPSTLLLPQANKADKIHPRGWNKSVTCDLLPRNHPELWNSSWFWSHAFSIWQSEDKTGDGHSHFCTYLLFVFSIADISCVLIRKLNSGMHYNHSGRDYCTSTRPAE
jgi:hypothetical protein